MKKVFTLVLVCTTLMAAVNADASVKYYRYSGNLPFVDMMLEMMAAMGIIQKVPAYGMYGGNYGGRYGTWSSLLSQQGMPYSGYGGYPNLGYGGYPNSGYGGWPGNGYAAGIPLTINPSLGFPGRSPVYSSWHNPYRSVNGPYDGSPFNRNMNRALSYNRYSYPGDGCYGGYCDGVYDRYRNIDGLWVANDGEMLGLRDGRFLWSDGDTAYTTGIIERTPVYIRAYIDDSDKKVVYRYKLIGNEMLTIDSSGTLRIFRRVPVNQAGAYLNRQSDAASVDVDARTDPGDVTGINTGIFEDPSLQQPDRSSINGQFNNTANWFLK